MPTLFETKYPNNSRVVSGVVTIYRDDVVLLCDTSIAPVVINLFDIPANYWSTQWKLYIIDNSNNASANNITINAGVGQNINTQANLVLNTDGSGALIRIVSNTNFIGNLTFVSGGGSAGYNTIKDEGVPLIQRTTMDFLGEFVTATDNGSETKITINPTIKEILSADLIALINSNSLVQGLSYKIIDTPYLESITLMAISENKLESIGDGLFYVADYQNLGDYSSVVPAFNSQLGRWNGTLIVAVGDVVIWNNLHYVNLTGTNTIAFPDVDLINWALLTKSTATGYILESVTANYNVLANEVSKITDVRLNEVDLSISKGQDSFLNFTWGSEAFFKNKIIGSQTVITPTICNSPITNFSSNIISNSLINFDIDFTLNNSSCNIQVENNLLFNNSQIEIDSSDISNTVEIYIKGNFLTGGRLTVENIRHEFFDSFFISNNQILENAQLSIGFGSTIIGSNRILLQSNYVNNNGQLYVAAIDSSTETKFVENNLIWNGATINVGLQNRANFIGNRVYFPQIIDLGLLSNNDLNGFNSFLSIDKSTFKAVLDLTDPLIYDAVNFTLNLSSYQWVGEFLLENGTGNQINKIINYFTQNRPITLFATSGGLVFRFSYVAIGSAGADEIVDNTNLNIKSNFSSNGIRNENATLVINSTIWFIQSRENWT